MVFACSKGKNKWHWVFSNTFIMLHSFPNFYYIILGQSFCVLFFMLLKTNINFFNTWTFVWIPIQIKADIPSTYYLIFPVCQNVVFIKNHNELAFCLHGVLFWVVVFSSKKGQVGEGQQELQPSSWCVCLKGLWLIIGPPRNREGRRCLLLGSIFCGCSTGPYTSNLFGLQTLLLSSKSLSPP